MSILRVFPRKTKATPDDALAFLTPPPKDLDLSGIDEIHISVTFSYDIDDPNLLILRFTTKRYTIQFPANYAAGNL